jgi:hypothetical protein
MDVWAKFLAGGEAVNLTATSQLEITTGTGITALQIAPDGAHVVVMATADRQRGPVRDVGDSRAAAGRRAKVPRRARVRRSLVT